MQVEKGDERVSNWELNLSTRQIDCEFYLPYANSNQFNFLDAANDVHSSMEVYKRLCDIAQLNAITLEDKKSNFTSDVPLPSTEKYM